MEDRNVQLICEYESRLDVYCAEHGDVTRNQAQRLIRDGSVTVNGKTEKPNCALKQGDSIHIVYPAPTQGGTAAENIPLDIVYQDGDLAVVNKPQGMVVHPAAGHADGTLVNALMYHMKDLSGIGGQMRPGIVHRIDRMTSGLLVIAKNDKTHLALSEQFREHSASRTYLAIATGNFKEDSGTIDQPIGRHKTDRKKMAVSPDGRDAVTHWQVLERFGCHTLLRVQLETGRTHQIRVHMAYIKHPLAGDGVYGSPKLQLGLDGQALHGYRLSFLHPGKKEQMIFYAPVPAYFVGALQKLGCRSTPTALMDTLKAMEKV